MKTISLYIKVRNFGLVIMVSIFIAIALIPSVIVIKNERSDQHIIKKLYALKIVINLNDIFDDIKMQIFQLITKNNKDIVPIVIKEIDTIIELSNNVIKNEEISKMEETKLFQKMLNNIIRLKTVLFNYVIESEEDPSSDTSVIIETLIVKIKHETSNNFSNFLKTILHDLMYNRIKTNEVLHVSRMLSLIGLISGTFLALIFAIIMYKKDNKLILAKQLADKANTSKSQFLANMSHEIRTPINAILGLSRLALKTDLTTKQKDYLDKILFSTSTLLGIINDILDFSKIEAGKIELESIDFDLEDILVNIANQLNIKAEEKGLELLFLIESNKNLSLTGDPLRIGQVLTNLVYNSIKFTQHGEIVVKAELETDSNINKEQGTLKFSVQDTGIGMTQDQQVSLFKPFSQADTSTTRQFGGTGLGLSISKAIIEMMGGNIYVESEPGKGSTFYFTVKVGLKTDISKNQFIIPNELESMRILVVDDNDTSRMILNNTLESFSFEVTQASSGKQAIEIIKENNINNEPPFKLILMDWKMPGIDGIETTFQIKNNCNLSYIPSILMVTAYDSEVIKQKAKDAGIKKFLVKPVCPSLLFNTIMNVFGHINNKNFVSIKKREQEIDLDNVRGAKILLTEDNKLNQQVAIEVLEHEGFFVTPVNNGQEAIEALMKDKFDLVLMDIQMPVMDGYIATKEIRQLDNESCNVPIISMTANAMKGEREKCLKIGMNDYLSKPIDHIELFSKLSKWIEHKERKHSSIAQDDNKEDSSNIEFNDISGIDVESGLRRLFGNKILYKKILFDFHTKYSNAAQIIRNYFENNELKKCSKMSHAIKGVAGNIGANDLHKTAGELEKMFITQNIGYINKTLDCFEEQSEIIFQSIEKLKKSEAKEVQLESSNDEDSLIDISQVEVLLKKLSHLLKLGDIESDIVLKEIKTCLKGTKMMTSINQIEENMNNFLYEEANEMVLDLTKMLGDTK
ncbi:multi-sensor hybrid histidine kinase [Candidatus Magnetomorum sp. HK-1]|nr:multi-sensor hybrid histidine kinase [Candidatus Magnetomorum sp. HK-1]